MIRLLVLALIIALPIVFFAQASSDGLMSPNNNDIPTLDLIYGAGEIPKIKYIVDEFMELQKIKDTPQAQVKANEIDIEINQLVLVEKYCNEKPSSLNLAHSTNPYKELQEMCPKLKSLEFSKAVSMWKGFF
ncbi:MAG: hypothetical protein OEL77_03150 [Nitrosopumilus sp.]|nr:hypothetical protein [Nitrosopumilus sp.]MDH3384993.1 hypothetical protein [Nitrosopumilus sp.]